VKEVPRRNNGQNGRAMIKFAEQIGALTEAVTTLKSAIPTEISEMENRIVSRFEKITDQKIVIHKTDCKKEEAEAKDKIIFSKRQIIAIISSIIGSGVLGAYTPEILKLLHR